jgi:phosphoglycolate phosphatase-like HAD superfamily hydrolase
MTKHIIWDWNGTLFHDIDAVVAATNAIFQTYRLDPLTADTFRATYTRPIWVAYENLLGRPLREGEWELLDTGYHEHYHQLMSTCDLDVGALAALREWQTAGGTQSLLSKWWHERLVPTVHGFAIDTYFDRVDGLRGTGGGPKSEHMAAHLQALGLDPHDVLVIGDSVDDADAARDVGARAVVYTGGMSSRTALQATGAPVVDSLIDALGYV